jgi:hypothetical protein
MITDERPGQAAKTDFAAALPRLAVTPAARSAESAPRKAKPVAGKKPAKKRTVRSASGRPTVPAPGGWERRKGGAALVRSQRRMR